MYEIDKTKFGPFVSALRKEKGYTQKELAEKLYISDKAISKWETGVSIPDTSLLIPLAEILGLSVTELLMCQRIETDTSLDNNQVEKVVKTAVSYSAENPARAFKEKSKWIIIYPSALLLGLLGTILCLSMSLYTETLYTITALSAIFGLYFCFFVRTKLPDYYKDNRLGFYMDGPVRMNIPGLAFNNSNWPYIVLCIRVWACCCMAVYPMLVLSFSFLIPEFWSRAELYICLCCVIGGLLVPIYIVGRKFE